MSRKRHPDTTKRGKFTEVLEQMVDAIAAGYVAEFKDTPEEARTRAELAIGQIQAQAGGGGLYVAKGHLWHIDERHRRIYQRFTGGNHAQLAKEFDLTERQIYVIVERLRREEFERRQMRLFDQPLTE
ncbi:Mor transcription activator family protein [Geobacter sp.]|uniref:Mor transcription activator family protein n=1 Tax=Geobacter sp. TaxID=46610 RepID=UPI002634A928|nr:Mor transcription activator family protein [Geobacter sp.]